MIRRALHSKVVSAANMHAYNPFEQMLCAHFGDVAVRHQRMTWLTSRSKSQLKDKFGDGVFQSSMQSCFPSFAGGRYKFTVPDKLEVDFLITAEKLFTFDHFLGPTLLAEPLQCTLSTSSSPSSIKLNPGDIAVLEASTSPYELHNKLMQVERCLTHLDAEGAIEKVRVAGILIDGDVDEATEALSAWSMEHWAPETRPLVTEVPFYVFHAPYWNIYKDLKQLQTEIASVHTDIVNLQTDVANLQTDVANLRSLFILSTYTAEELRRKASERGLTLSSRAKKGEIIRLLAEHQ